MVGLESGLLLLLGVDALLILSAAEGQQGHHIGLGQRRIAAVGDGGLAGSSVQAERDVVILDASGGAQVDDRLDADGVGEGDVAALQVVAGSGDDGAAFGDGDAAQQRGSGDGSAQAQIDIAGQLGIGVLKVQLRR